MKQLSTLLMLICIWGYFTYNAYANEERTNHYTQVTVYFAMNSLTEEYDDTEYMQEHIDSQGFIKTIMERTDTTMQIHQYGFGPFPLDDDPARDSIINTDGLNNAKSTLTKRAWSAMDYTLKNEPNHFISKKIKEIKDLTGATFVSIVIIANNRYYKSYGEYDSPIIVINNTSNRENHLAIHNKIIFENPDNIEGAHKEYPEGHPNHPYKYATIFAFGTTIWVYPRTGEYLDEYGFWIDIEGNVNTPDIWQLENLYNTGLLEF